MGWDEDEEEEKEEEEKRQVLIPHLPIARPSGNY